MITAQDKYCGLNVNQLTNLPSFYHDGFKTLRDCVERPIRRIPKYSQQIEKYVQRRMSKLHPRAVLGMPMMKEFYDMPIVPLSAFVAVFNLVNKYLSIGCHKSRPLTKEHVAEHFNKVMYKYSTLLSEDARHFLSQALQDFCIRVETCNLSSIPDFNGIANQLAFRVHYWPYFNNAGDGACVVLTDRVTTDVHFLICLQHGVSQLNQNPNVIPKHALPVFMHNLSDESPLGFGRHSGYAQRELTFVMHYLN